MWSILLPILSLLLARTTHKHGFDGYDHRFNKEVITSDMERIHGFFEKKALLQKLESNHTNLLTKSMLARHFLDQERIKPTNLRAGLKSEGFEDIL